MLSVLLVPFGDGRGLVHVLDDLPPTDSGVVRAEGDLTELGRVRNDAHLGTAEVVIEKVLEPHSGDKQEVPWIVPPFLDVVHRPVAADLAVTLARQAER